MISRARARLRSDLARGNRTVKRQTLRRVLPFSLWVVAVAAVIVWWYGTREWVGPECQWVETQGAFASDAVWNGVAFESPPRVIEVLVCSDGRVRVKR